VSIPRDKVYIIVEGHGEADPPRPGVDPAAKTLVAKMLHHQQRWDWFPAKYNPYRLSSCGDFYPHTQNLLQVLNAHRKFQDCVAVLVLFDLDDGCPSEVGLTVARRIREVGPWPFSIAVVCAHREYEAWFLASLETIHPGHAYTEDPEALRDAKGWLTREFGYREVFHQAEYTQRLDVATALCSRSFRRLHHAFEQLSAIQDHAPVVTPGET
jgi:hypothetical protein